MARAEFRKDRCPVPRSATRQTVRPRPGQGRYRVHFQRRPRSWGSLHAVIPVLAWYASARKVGGFWMRFWLTTAAMLALGACATSSSDDGRFTVGQESKGYV